MKTILIRCGLLVLFGLAADNAAAVDGVYQIELVVFAQQQPTTETFGQTSSLIDWPGNLTELSSHQTAPKSLLAAAYAALKQNRWPRPLLHAAWIQTVASDSAGEPVHVQNDEVDGFVEFKRGQFLEFRVDMEYAPPGDGLVYRLAEQRQLRLEEAHYFDHPKFGIIAEIKKIDKTD